MLMLLSIVVSVDILQINHFCAVFVLSNRILRHFRHKPHVMFLKFGPGWYERCAEGPYLHAHVQETWFAVEQGYNRDSTIEAHTV